MANPQMLQESAFTADDAAAVRFRFLALGLLSVVLGVGAITLPLTTDYNPAVTLGLLLAIIGAADVYHAFQLASRQGFLLSWMSAILFFFMGLWLMFSPLTGSMSLPYLLGLMFVLGGALRVGKGLGIRPVSSWAWIVVSGTLGIVFGFVILWQWRTITLTDISILAGIAMIMDGWSRMILFWLGERAVHQKR